MIFPGFLSRPERIGGDIADDLIEDADVEVRVRSVLVRPRVDLADVLQLRVVDRERALRPLRRHRDVRPVRHQLLVPQVPGHLVDEIEHMDGYMYHVDVGIQVFTNQIPIHFTLQIPYVAYMEAIQETNYLNAMVNLLLAQKICHEYKLCTNTPTFSIIDQHSLRQVRHDSSSVLASADKLPRRRMPQ